MRIRQVTLNGGPFDGMVSMVSHDTAVHRGEVYVWDGGEDKDRFGHAKTLLSALDRKQWHEERSGVKVWMAKPTNEMLESMGIPSWRLNAWLQLLQYGEV